MNIVLFDGVCNLCNSTVKYLIKYDKKNVLHFAAQQSIAGEKIMNKYLIEKDGRSVFFIKDELVYYKSDAIIEICKLVTGWPRVFLIGIVIPKWIRNKMYDLIANNRYVLFGKQAACSIPSKATEHKFID